MPKYELMYIIGTDVSETDIPKIIEEVKGYIAEFGGEITKHEELGKRRLAYPIQKTRNGYYVLAQFTVDSLKLNEIEKKLQANQEVIRHLLLNIDEALIRMEKDRAVQAKLQPRKETAEALKPKPVAKRSKKIEIDLDAEIEKALESKDLT